MRIGQLAREVGLNPKTLRYYEELGLLPTPRRTSAGYRLYDATARARLEFIRQAKALGFSLSEISEVLALRSECQRPCPQVLAMLDRKLAETDARIRRLTEFRQHLAGVRMAAETLTGDAAVCEIIEKQNNRPESSNA